MNRDVSAEAHVAVAPCSSKKADLARFLSHNSSFFSANGRIRRGELLPFLPASHPKKFRLILPLDAKVFEQANH
jgi:hypothetical protein